MTWKKVLLYIVCLLLSASVFFPWVAIESKNLVLSGMNTTGTAYGKPGLLSLVFAGLIAFFSLVPRIWAHRISIFFGALGSGWALRNFLLLSVCQGGECPQRQTAFYLYLIFSLLLLVIVLIQEMKIKTVDESINVPAEKT